MVRKSVLGFLAVICGWLVLIGLPPGVSAAVVDKIVAIVNDEIITLSDLEVMMKSAQEQPGLGRHRLDDQTFKRELLEALVDRKLAKEEAKRRGLTIPDKEVDQALANFRQRNQLTDDASFAQALAKSGISLQEFKQQIADQLLMDRLIQMVVGSKVTVTDADMRRFYDSQYPKQSGELVHLRLLNLPYPPGATASQKEEVKVKAEIILTEHRQGVTLEALKQKHSLTLTDLGFISLADMDPAIGRLLERLRPGEVAPIQTPQGFQLIQLVAKKTGRPRSYEEVAPEIRQLLTRQEMERRFSEWVKGLREKAHIKIML